MRIFLCGQKAFGAAVLELILRRGHTVVGVSSPAWKAPYDDLGLMFEGAGTEPDRLRAAAARGGVPWQMAGGLRAASLPPNTDLVIAAHSYDFIGRGTRAAAKLGAVGFHPSLLPLHRGRDAIRWAVKMGDKVTGGSVFWLNDSVDGGDIAAQDYCFIRPGDTPEKLWRRDLFPMGIRLFDAVLSDIGNGRLVRITQDESLASWEPSWERPPLFRPELPQLGGVAGFEVVRLKSQLVERVEDEQARA